ncbi:hypothetical protein [Halorarius litoreus]|uniref:hypothetical protein n=1 Tax=Halorarius litoreus TaxID=2962676 RepID=UPI0020CD058B|nr:hypothetical protein [Halorarius litoreus]
MFASSTPGDLIAFQPENRAEELVLFRLFSRVEPPDCWLTHDVDVYEGLDEDLAREAATDGSFAPGTRALVVVAPEIAEEATP